MKCTVREFYRFRHQTTWEEVVFSPKKEVAIVEGKIPPEVRFCPCVCPSLLTPLSVDQGEFCVQRSSSPLEGFREFVLMPSNQNNQGFDLTIFEEKPNGKGLLALVSVASSLSNPSALFSGHVMINIECKRSAPTQADMNERMRQTKKALQAIRFVDRLCLAHAF